MAGGGFPGGKRFAFSIIDDTDVATVENVRPVYRLLAELRFRTTKTIWPLACPEGSRNFSSSQTLDEPDYRAFVLDLRRSGFEITWHGATMESSRRDRTIEGLERFHQIFGAYPRVHANHAYNRENLYWGAQRLDHPLLRFAYGRQQGVDDGYYAGHLEGSPYWWGDLAQRHIEYVRNLTFDEINLLRINPSMPYHDPRRPVVRWWFSATDAEDAAAFAAMLSPANQDRLEREGGVCIVATHFGKRFTRDGVVVPEVARALESLAARPGWFPVVSELLDYLRGLRSDASLPAEEWRRMQWRWAIDTVRRRVRRRWQ